jgi:hypothetical protein
MTAAKAPKLAGLAEAAEVEPAYAELLARVIPICVSQLGLHGLACLAASRRLFGHVCCAAAQDAAVDLVKQSLAAIHQADDH